MSRWMGRPGFRTWMCAGLFCSCAALPVWSQDPYLPDPTGQDFDPLPPAITTEFDEPPPFAEMEENQGALDSDAARAQQAQRTTGNTPEQASIDSQRTFMTAMNNAEETAKLSRDSFERGLMGLQDYADQLNATLEIRLTIASLQNDRAARIEALSENADLARNAARQLREFNQPAAVGWEADTAYAELLSANADLRLAAARGDRSTYDAAMARSQQWSDTQYDMRLSDFDQGLASFSSLTRAGSHLTTNSGLPSTNRTGEANETTKLDEYISKLEDVAEQTREFSELDAGIGRADRLHQAEYELARAKGQAALQRKDLKGAALEFDKAIESSQALFDAQVEFFQSGTASLRDVTHAWWNRVELTDLSERAGLKTDPATRAETDADLRQLRQLIASQEDRRGRIAADVAYERSLESLQGLWARQRAAIAMANAQQAAAKKSPGAGSRILDFNKQKAAAGTVVTPPAKPAPEIVAPKTNPGIPGTTGVTSEKSPTSGVEIIRPKRAPKR